MRLNIEDASDAELLNAAHRDAEAFAVFYRRYERLVVGWLARQTRRPDLVPELTAEVFAAAYIDATRFRGDEASAASWIVGIARHKLLRSLRRDRIDASARRRLAVERIEVSDASIAAIEELRDCGLLELLEALPPDQREAVRLRIIEEADYAELAQTLQISPASARQRVSRGLAALRKSVKHQGESA